ncbi:PAS/PAC sensor(s)-containing diguanylate cyclase/phosphodiesterase [Candidatus Nitrosoglobus terrae]|uniref:PAS/PAC sensor(S)-containing diguanylate cyclase/phosphodiesterase n=1 Tax=Candidatus Nitrosoglobus terrae TaxID=1630141 RepID=A0A1Q2SPQ5_9GAMM|nr:EAL domain-containing protein [Candidatus Nitrosoglobus terrae]BAW81087.1 PAS/PAC sensor(s)-containing diguanylate cyclase/phosphodiesterase [Candidatus Nitrosoglobus terrae]
MQDTEQAPLLRFLSLKWKAALVFSLILIAIIVSLGGMAYVSLLHQFTVQREQAYLDYQRQIQGIMEHSYSHMEKLADIMPLIYEKGSEDNSLLGRIQAISIQHKNLLQTSWGLKIVGLYSTNNELLGTWEPQMDTSQVSEWVYAANETEQPVTGLDCKNTCIQYIAVPLLDEDDGGVLLLSCSLADIATTFHKISGSDISIIADDEISPENEAKSYPLLPEWGVRVEVFTHVNRNLRLLQAVARHHALATIDTQSVWQSYRGREYEIQLMAIKTGSDEGLLRLAIISDLTDKLAAIQVEAQKIFLGGFIGLVISEALLLILLEIAIVRLRRVAVSLPYLADHNFEATRENLESPARQPWWQDEISVLDNATFTLSYQLEILQTEIQERTLRLAERSNDLIRERDFVTGLLNTAPVIILTQNAAGQVTMLNRQGLMITGYNIDEIMGRPFNNLLAGNKNLPRIIQELEELRVGYRDHLRVDMVLRSRNGEQRIISWLHSRLTARSPYDGVLLSVGHDVTERKQAEQKLTWLADHDPLTELFNRRRFQHEFEQILIDSQHHQRNGSLLYFDLDQFKYINDTYGHQSGDLLLKAVADKLRQVIRANDIVARLGGDEFAVVIAECDTQGAIQTAKRVCTQLGELEFPILGHSHSISASIGITLFPLHGATAPELMANADLAMYQAKDAGRGGWHLFSIDEKARDQMRKQVYWKEQIEQALREDRFLLYFQPILEIKTNTIHHYEVLLRMRDSEGKIIISPDKFIPVAEKSGLIHAIDHLVLRKAITKISQLPQEHKLTFSINLSGRVVDDPNLLPILEGLLNTTNIDPSLLIFEITETAAVANLVAAENFIRKIKAYGCYFAMDDFGMGFSSFFYLKHLPVDYIKIDGTFVRQLVENPQDRVLIKALSDIAKGLGKKSVAEFVESAEILALLREYGVDYAQGYYVGRPDIYIAETHKFSRGNKLVWCSDDLRWARADNTALISSSPLNDEDSCGEQA